MASQPTHATTTADEWLQAASTRRSIYGLAGTSIVSDDRVQDIIAKVQSFAPSAFNSQPVRYSLVTDKEHKELWDAIIKASEPVLKVYGDSVWSAMEKSFLGHKSAYGSIVFWESAEAQKQAMEKHKSAAPLLPQFGEHASGMAQLLVWTALELEGVGANLQHLQSIPPAEAAMRKVCGVPDSYSLRAHLNYGDKSQPHPGVPPNYPLPRRSTRAEREVKHST